MYKRICLQTGENVVLLTVFVNIRDEKFENEEAEPFEEFKILISRLLFHSSYFLISTFNQNIFDLLYLIMFVRILFSLDLNNNNSLPISDAKHNRKRK